MSIRLMENLRIDRLAAPMAERARVSIRESKPMADQTPVTLNHFVFFKFRADYYSLPAQSRQPLRDQLLAGLRRSAPQIQIYQVYPISTDADVVVWSTVQADNPRAAADFFSAFTRETNPCRGWIDPVWTLWGFTRPSQYTRSRSTQEIDPFSPERKTYLIIYPFSKDVQWYLMSREARQGMMNEHIKVGKQYPDIHQLLLYSIGLQDQEFVVVYETENLVQFSELVQTLRSTEARRNTSRDTPVYAAVYHPAGETLSMWE